MLLPIADRVGATLYAEGNPRFLQKHYNPAYPVLSFLEDRLAGGRQTTESQTRRGHPNNAAMGAALQGITDNLLSWRNWP